MRRLIDADALIAEMHNVILEDGEDRRTFYEVIERQPTIEPEKELSKMCEELKAHANYLSRENDRMKGQIKALAFAVRCNGISGNEVRYETD